MEQKTIMPDGYVYITKLEDLKPALSDLPLTQHRCIDVETSNFDDPHNGKVRLLQIGTPNEKNVLIDLFRIRDVTLIQEFFTRDAEAKVVYIGHNIKYELKYLIHLGLIFTPYIYDTMIADQLLHAGKRGFKFTLKAVVARYLHIDIDKRYQSGGWIAPRLSDEQLQYASDDVLYPHKVFLIQRDLLIRHNLIDVAAMEFKCIPVVANMELCGVHVDQEALERYRQYLVETQKKHEAYIYEILGLSDDVNIYSPQQFLEVLHKNGLDVKNTRKDTLSAYKESHPFIVSFLKCKSIDGILSRHVNKIPEFINKKTGNIHSSFFQTPGSSHGAVTGRFASARPNMQNIPKMQQMRECFIPHEGNVFIDGDYSQVEVRVMAEIANDTVMIQTLNDSADLYKSTAALCLKKNVEDITDDERTKIKGVVLGLIYGMQVHSMRRYITNTLGTPINVEETQYLFDMILSTWSGVKQYHHRVQRERPTTTRTLSGRIRYFQEFNFNEVVNAPIQGTAADIVKVAMALLAPRLRDYHAHIILMVHDEILVECPEDVAQDVYELQMNTMREAGEKIITSVPILVDGGIGTNWFDAK